jgi:fibronectin type 3 domain-containing protein
MKRLVAIFILSLFSINAYALSCNDVNGSYVYSPDGTYLGFFGNQFASDSISNNYGTYGSEYNSLSMNNSYGTYGNPYGSKSATNPYALASNVPILYKYGSAIAYITANTFTSGGVTLGALLACGSSASFAATSAPDPVPSAVTGFAASQGTSSSNVYLAWTSSSYATSYDIYNSTSSNGSLNFIGNTISTSATVQNVSAGTTYYYFVYPKNSSGTGSGVYTTGFAGSSPSALPSLTASDGTSTENVTLSWGAAAGADTYKIMVADTLEGSKTDLGFNSGTSATITGGAPGVQYFYFVYPYNSVCLDCVSGTGRYDTGYIAAPAVPNVAPVVSISGGNRNISDTDSAAGETVSFTATATDSDGSVASSSWLVAGEVVASGTSANLTLGDGSTTVTFRATDDDGESTSTSVTITVAAPVIPNVAPVVAIIGGNRSIVDTDGLTGETVSLSATATDADGELASTSWLIGDAEVATGTSANLALGDGSTTVTFRATDDDGDSTSTTVTITVAAPVVSNVAPVVAIIGGNRSIVDTDGLTGETVSLSATATDADGELASTSWLIGDAEVATGTSANLALGDGSTTVTFRATDDDGDSTSTTVTITVAAPVVSNVAPVVAIIGGNRSIVDTDGLTGETVSLSATATDADGELASTSWLIGDAEVATGTSANLALGDGSTTVTFRATDDDGDSTSTSVTITVVAPVVANGAPVVSISGGDRTVSLPGSILVSANAVDSDGTIEMIEWIVDKWPQSDGSLSEEVIKTDIFSNPYLSSSTKSSYVSFNWYGSSIELQITARATDSDGNSSSATVTVFVIAQDYSEPAPIVSIDGGDRTLIDDDENTIGIQLGLTATVKRSDGTNIGNVPFSSEWWVDDEKVSSGRAARLTFFPGATEVIFKSTSADGNSSSTSVVISVIQIRIAGGDRTIPDSDGATGETVPFSLSAPDSLSSLSNPRWRVENGSGTTTYETTVTPTNLPLLDGINVVSFRAEDGTGNTKKSPLVTITVSAPLVANVAPVVSISGGDRTVSDGDSNAGETVSLSASATDSDGSVSRTEWLVGGSVVATGTSANLSLSDGASTVTFRATDDDGDSTSTTVTITVAAPVVANVAPEVSINLAQAQIIDTDGVAGEVVSVTATATDSDGELASTSWLIGDEVVASGTSARLALSDGSTMVTFRATDEDGDSKSTSVTITVEAPVETEEEFVTEYNGISAPSFLSEEINTVSVFDMNKLKLRSCIRLTLGGEPYSLNGYERYDMNFNLLSLDDLTFKLVDFRPFNLNGSRNQFGETPDCSGQFELSSNVYKDIIAVPGTTEAGNLRYDYYDLVLDLIDMDSLLFRLRDISIIAGAD